MMETEKMAQKISWQRKVRCGMLEDAQRQASRDAKE